MSRLIVYSSLVLGIFSSSNGHNMPLMWAHVVFLLYGLYRVRNRLFRYLGVSLVVAIIGYVLSQNPEETLISGDVCAGYVMNVYVGGVGVRVLECGSLGKIDRELYVNCSANRCPAMYTKRSIMVTSVEDFGMLAGHGVFTVADIKELSLLDESKLRLLGLGYAQKERFYNVLQAFSSKEVASLGTGILFGEIGGSGDLREVYKSLGILHIVAISGVNILYLQRIYKLLSKKESSIVVLSFLFVIVGEEFTLLRAIVALIITSIIRKSGELRNQYDFLYTFVFFLVQEPRMVESVSFWLVFGACTGINIINPSLRRRLETKSRLLLELIFSVSIWLGVSPFLMLFFGKVSFVGILIGMVLGPYVEFATLVGYCTFLVVTVAPWMAQSAAITYAVLISLIVNIALLFHGIM